MSQPHARRSYHHTRHRPIQGWCHGAHPVTRLRRGEPLTTRSQSLSTTCLQQHVHQGVFLATAEPRVLLAPGTRSPRSWWSSNCCIEGGETCNSRLSVSLCSGTNSRAIRGLVELTTAGRQCCRRGRGCARSRSGSRELARCRRLFRWGLHLLLPRSEDSHDDSQHDGDNGDGNRGDSAIGQL